MSQEVSTELPRRIVIKELLKSRSAGDQYQAGSKPVIWQNRRPGLETVLTTNDEKIVLYSAGGQASPAPGWTLLLTKYHHSETPVSTTILGNFELSCPIEWTLYGIKKKQLC